MKRPIWLLFLIGICLISSGQNLMAQESGTIQATATVISSLSVIGVSNLNFGTVTPGVNKSVDKVTVGDAGEWSVNGTALVEVTVDFTLPTQLYTIDSSATLSVNFNSTDASYDDGTGGGQAAPAGTINPNIPGTHNLGAAGDLSVWIGGTAQPTISQTGGNYSSDVIMTIAYTGS